MSLFALINMYNLKSRRMRERLVPILSFVLLLQGLFPLQLHTMLAVDADGNIIQVCTLNGIESVYLDSDKPENDQSGQPLSAAIAFSSILLNALPDVAVPSLQLAKQTSDNIVLTVKSGVYITASRNLPIRAPPIA